MLHEYWNVLICCYNHEKTILAWPKISFWKSQNQLFGQPNTISLWVTKWIWNLLKKGPKWGRWCLGLSGGVGGRQLTWEPNGLLRCPSAQKARPGALWPQVAPTPSPHQRWWTHQLISASLVPHLRTAAARLPSSDLHCEHFWWHTRRSHRSRLVTSATTVHLVARSVWQSHRDRHFEREALFFIRHTLQRDAHNRKYTHETSTRLKSGQRWKECPSQWATRVLWNLGLRGRRLTLSRLGGSEKRWEPRPTQLRGEHSAPG